MSGTVKDRWSPSILISPSGMPRGLWSGLTSSPVQPPPETAGFTRMTIRSTVAPTTSTPCQAPATSWAWAGTAAGRAKAALARSAAAIRAARFEDLLMLSPPWAWMSGLAVCEDGLDGHLEQAGDLEGERQGRVVL